VLREYKLLLSYRYGKFQKEIWKEFYMKKEFLIESLNVKNGEALTLEKAEDRIEFEALILSLGDLKESECDKCTCYTAKDCWNWDCQKVGS